MMIPYGRQDIDEHDIEAVVRVLRSDWLTQGPMVPRLEQTVSAYCGASHAVAANSATASLHLACLALGLGPGDRLWTSPITFVASANCAIYCNADVDFVDIDPKTYNMSVCALEAKLNEAEKNGRLPKILVPVHLCGQSCEMERIYELGQRFGFKIIEDASHAIGARYQGRPVGDCRFSDITVFSFHPVKIVTTAEGGMATTNSAELAALMMRMRSHGITNDAALMEQRPEKQIWNYQQIELGYNYRLTDMQAALGVSQLEKLDQFIERRHELARVYNHSFSDLPVRTPWQHPDSHSSYHLFILRIAEEINHISQKDTYKKLHSKGISANLHYIPVYLQPFYRRRGFNAGYCPEAEKYFEEAITLPLYPSLSNADQEYVISIIRDIFN